jgi:microcystin-dependent protein
MFATIGQVELFSGSFVPVGWLPCDGRLLRFDDPSLPSSGDNELLGEVLGARFGGDGRTTFALPRIADPAGMRYLICRDGMFGALDEPTFAELILFAGSAALADTLPCDGRLLQVRDNQPLFSLLGSTYGGDGFTVFAVPNLPDLTPGVRYLIGVGGLFPTPI